MFTPPPSDSFKIFKWCKDLSMKTSIILFTSFLLAVSFLSLSLAFKSIAKGSSKDYLQQKQFLCEYIYREVHAELEKPILVSKMMASDEFLLDFLKNEGELKDDEETMKKYLCRIKDDFGFAQATLISAATHRYYRDDEMHKIINPLSDTHDVWFYWFESKGKQVVVLLDICSPIDVASWQDQVDALVCTWQGGQESGFSVADVLSGKVNPSGKLPMTFQIKYGDAYADKNFPANVDDKTLGAMFMWGYNKDQAPKERQPQANIDYTNYEEDIYVGYRYFDSFGKPVAYPFGFGLSYTTFAYENMSVSEANGVYTVKIDVKNTGKCAGRNVVELFVAAPNSKKLNKPEKELRNYAKTKCLKPGETETVAMQVKTEDLASFNEKASAWKTDAGLYTFMICSSASDVEAQATAKVKAWTKKVHNVMQPNVKLNLLKR